ncbi:MAG: DUF951 domain-containing protein [Clostridia bacterium]|nr:DUF951 domain-containing protein [Clostridia bacterium]
MPKLFVGDILTLKKAHPCGTNSMRVARVGSDIRIICNGCGRDMTLPREKLEKAIRSIESNSDGDMK